MLEYALERANEMPHIQGQRRVYAAVVDKRGRILAEGFNSYIKTHPVQAYYAEKVDLPERVYLHAEIAALIRVRHGNPYKIFVARVDANGNPMLAAPCEVCSEAIRCSGIKSVEYTVGLS